MLSIPIVSEFDGKGIKKAIAEFKNLETNGEKAQFALKKAAVPAAAALAGMAVAAKDAVGAASDLAEAQSKANVIFGEGAAEINKFAATAASKLGQSKQDVLDAAGTFGTFGKAAGLTGKQLAKFSTDLTGLASDLASFNNASPEEVIQAMGAALRGEAEPMRRFGVLLTADTIKAEAMRMGLVKMNVDTVKLEQAQIRAAEAQDKYSQAVRKHGVDSMEALKAQNAYEMASRKVGELSKGKADALTQEQKILAANSLIFRQTADAQGDFARTSDGLANSSRVLSAQFEDMKVSLGQALLPAVQAVLPLVKGFADWAAANPTTFKLIAAAIAAVAAAVVAVNAAMAVNPFTLIAAGIAVLVVGLVAAYKKFETFRSVVQTVVNGIAGYFEFMVNAWIKVINTVIRGINLVKPGKDIPSMGTVSFGRLGQDAASSTGGVGLVVPAMANGGIVTSPTLALIGEAGPEAVVPLNRAGGMGGVTINVNGGDPQAVVNALRRYMQQNGSVPIRVSA